MIAEEVTVLKNQYGENNPAYAGLCDKVADLARLMEELTAPVPPPEVGAPIDPDGPVAAALNTL